ncbi:hypothetical protein C7974DRAFT_103476 [Boeremia exigua]|uniref:uncharacterized protein n=1 Tax=Boeremia exigua TaxID=749465 RepID=UPI001E8ED581|nr:uncharacterized protein C7974DRAFT_103476 [Boeremia exigua]KAH6642510.1 hypothetical protein C7974DRAFT_103476 [Boeremia exigua]
MEKSATESLLAENRNEKLTSAPELREYRPVYWLRLVLRILSLLTCALICFSLIDAIRNYRSTKHVRNPFHEGSGSLPVWPEKEGLKLYPTYVLLGAAIVAGALSFVLVIASFTKVVRRMTKVGNISTIVVSSICLVLWVAVTAYYGTWDTSETNWDLLSWTCTHRNYEYQDIDFSETCTAMRFSFWAGVGLAGLEALNLGIFVIWWLRTRGSREYSKV